MKNLTLELALAIGCIIMTGCNASGPVFSGLSQIESNKSQVIVYRPSSFYGCTLTQEIYIDEVKISKLLNGGYSLFEINPGEHIIKIQNNMLSTIMSDGFNSFPVNVSIETQPAKCYFVKYTITGDANATYFEIDPISSDIGLMEVKNLRLCK